jgi:hypothetical protein
MDFSDKELKVLLQSLYRFRGEVSGASQSEQNKLGLVATVIDKIEAKVGPLTAERTRFDREMDESLAILKTGKMGVAKAARAKAQAESDAAAAGLVARAGSAKAGAAKPQAAKAKTSATEPKTKKASGVSKKSGASK